MADLSDKIREHAKEADTTWGGAHGLLSSVIEKKRLKTGVEVGVAFGGHAQSILEAPTVERLYGIDPYKHIDGYNDPMNLPQEEFDEVYKFTLDRLSGFGERYRHLRKFSKDAIDEVPEVDFVYIDADHSYEGVWGDICTWFPKVRAGGVIAGHDYDHSSFPGVKRAVDGFFERIGWEVHSEGEGVWWVEKRPLGISFFMPAYNCDVTVEESVESMMDGNFSEGDELVITNDSSTDGTGEVLDELKAKYPELKVVNHLRNKGGAAARNTAIEKTGNPLLFCLDSDNILVPASRGCTTLMRKKRR